MSDSQPWHRRWLGALARALGRPIEYRREPRFRIPTHVPLHCIPADAMSFEAEIVEISRGGMAVMVYESTINLAPGRVLRECKLVVPGQVPIVVDLEVRNTNPIALPGVGPTRRAGLRILDRSVGIAALFRVLGADPAAG